uniref:Syndecan domain-containing protein n=1 Tax=Rhabditophanes sp. KR3021 TaxID=114890 RepID=A0AC35TTS2_9BILA
MSYNFEAAPPPPTTYTPSVDRVIDKISHFAGEINYLGNEGTKLVDGIVDSAEKVINNQISNFNDIGDNADKIGNTATTKFDGWPVTPAIVAGIVTAIIAILLIIFFVIYVFHLCVSWRQLRRAEKNLSKEYGYITSSEFDDTK